MVDKEEWFVDWFDSYHYHILYENRDVKEAEAFIQRLFQYLKLSAGARVLDLACGKGRHAVQVNGLGFDVLGVDLSQENIKMAKCFKGEGIDFEVADMRELNLNNQFDLILNLFTSFGYFKKEGDNLKAIASISKSLTKGGLLVLDYLNVLKVKQDLPSSEIVQKNNIRYSIDKKVKNQFIEKQISFEEKGSSYQYKEFVKCIDLSMFTSYFENNGMKIIQAFGDYQLNEFKRNESERLIIIAEKL